jgi:hypothetical protein
MPACSKAAGEMLLTPHFPFCCFAQKTVCNFGWLS